MGMWGVTGNSRVYAYVYTYRCIYMCVWESVVHIYIPHSDPLEKDSIRFSSPRPDPLKKDFIRFRSSNPPIAFLGSLPFKLTPFPLILLSPDPHCEKGILKFRSLKPP